MEGIEWYNLADFEEVEDVGGIRDAIGELGVCGVAGVVWVSGLVLGLSALVLRTWH